MMMDTMLHPQQVTGELGRHRHCAFPPVGVQDTVARRPLCWVGSRGGLRTFPAAANAE